MIKTEANSILFWSWKKLNPELKAIRKNNYNLFDTKSNLAANLIAAFLIVVMASYCLGLVRKTLINPYIPEKSQKSQMIVYSNIG